MRFLEFVYWSLLYVFSKQNLVYIKGIFLYIEFLVGVPKDPIRFFIHNIHLKDV